MEGYHEVTYRCQEVSIQFLNKELNTPELFVTRMTNNDLELAASLKFLVRMAKVA